MSEVVVKRLQDQPWCAAAAKPMRATAPQRLWTCDTNMIGVTASAQISIAVLRALLTVQPRLIKEEDNHPPPTLPMSAIKYIAINGGPIVVRSRPCVSRK